MPISRTNLADFSYFLAITRNGSMRKAAIEMGVTASALSHALKSLEGRLGVRLFNRTNRSVTLTAAGEELRDAIAHHFDAINDATDLLNRYREAPAGQIRLNVPVIAATMVLAPVMPVFAKRYPDVRVDITITNRMADIIAEGFDAGIRHGGTIPADMIGQRLTPDFKWVVAASPDYIERYGYPSEPNELRNHSCIGTRHGDYRFYNWEFEGPRGEFSVSVPAQVTADEPHAMTAMALAGGGFTYGEEHAILPHVKRGELRLVLESWAPTGPGYHLYYSSSRQVPLALRLLLELIRELKPLG